MTMSKSNRSQRYEKRPSKKLTVEASEIIRDIQERVLNLAIRSPKGSNLDFVIYIGKRQLRELRSYAGLYTIDDKEQGVDSIANIPFIRVIAQDYLAVYEVS